MSAGSEGQGESGAGFERAEMNEGLAGFGFDGQHEVDGASDGGGAAEDAGFVGVMDEQDSGVANLGQVAQVGEDGIDGEGAVLVPASDDIHEGIDDDEAGGVGAGLLGQLFGLAAVAQVVGAHADKVKQGAGRRLVGVEGGMQAGEHAGVAGLFVYDEDGGGVGRAAQPILPQGDADGQIESGVSLFGAGSADEQVEAGAGEETLDEPVDGRRDGESFIGVVDEAFGAQGFSGRQAGSADGDEHVVAVGQVTHGEHEGLLAGDAVAAAAGHGVVDALPGFGQREVGRRDGAMFDELGE